MLSVPNEGLSHHVEDVSGLSRALTSGFKEVGQLTRVNVPGAMSFGLNPEIEPQQGRGKFDVLVSSRRGTSTDTTGPNCSPDIFFSRPIGFFHATKRDEGFSCLDDNHRC